MRRNGFEERVAGGIILGARGPKNLMETKAAKTTA
jgi:hypothetical protein